MRENLSFDPASVRAVYEGVQAQLYELFMGKQIHVGGYRSTLELAGVAGVASGQTGIELCCGTGASMRVLVRLLQIASMTGVELASTQVERGRTDVERDGLRDRITFVNGDATASGLASGEADFVWGEDAWCYVPDKAKLIAEAVRVTRAGGVIAFTDWVVGPTITEDEADHVMQTMNFPNFQSIDGYRTLLEDASCEVFIAEDTGRFGPSFALYAEMLRSPLAFGALELIDFSEEIFDLVVTELDGLSRLGSESKLIQGRFVARKPT